MIKIKGFYFSQLLKLSLVFLIFIQACYADQNKTLALETEDQAEALLSVKIENTYCYGEKNHLACLLQLIAGSNTPVALTLVNRSTRVTAYYIQAILPANMGVTQDASNCAILPPLSSCTLRFFPGITIYPQVSVPIIGTNAATAYVTMEVLPPTTLSIAVAGSPLNIPKNGSLSLTITNTSNFIAYNIHSDFIGTALDGQVIESANTCAAVAPGANCLITYTAGNTVVAPTSFPIFGTNTITVNAVISVVSPFAYITNNVGAGNITRCLRDTVTGQLSGCNVTGSSTAQPNTIVFNSTHPVAYISNLANNNVTQCNVTPVTGTLTACGNIGIAGLANLGGLSLNPTGSYIYILNAIAGATPVVIKCPIDGVGQIAAGCIDSGATAPAQVHQGITFNAAGTRAYIVNFFQTTLCNVDLGTGQLSGCGNTASINLANGKLTLNATETFAYVATAANAIIKCAVLNTGALSGCVNSGAALLNSPQNIALDESNNFAYITNSLSQNVTKCMIDPVTGNLFNCVNSGATSVTTPEGITLN